jgi:hypothetical protein
MDPEDIAQDVSDMLDAEEADHTEVWVKALDLDTQADGAAEDDVL